MRLLYPSKISDIVEKRKTFHGINNVKELICPPNHSYWDYGAQHFGVKRGISIANRLWKENKQI